MIGLFILFLVIENVISARGKWHVIRERPQKKKMCWCRRLGAPHDFVSNRNVVIIIKRNRWRCLCVCAFTLREFVDTLFFLPGRLWRWWWQSFVCIISRWIGSMNFNPFLRRKYLIYYTNHHHFAQTQKKGESENMAPTRRRRRVHVIQDR